MDRRHLLIGSQIILLLACLWAFFGLLCAAWFGVSTGYLSGDALIFQTVGRGILNGITPWSGLFETKPGAVFILSAMSLKLFGNQTLVTVTQAIAILAMPFCLLFPAMEIAKEQSPVIRRFVTLAALLFGTILALYSANQAGYGLAESYGAALAMGYGAVISDQRFVMRGKWKMGFLGILMLAAIGFKEPFLFSMLAIAVLLLPRENMWKRISTDVIAPMAIATVIGVAALLALGWFDSFFHVYLPHMMSFHIFQEDESIVQRTFDLSRTWNNLATYSIPFAAAVTLLWVSVPFLSLQKRSGELIFAIRWIFASILAFLAVGIGGDFYGHHFIFAVPFYAALFLAALRLFIAVPSHAFRISAGAFSALLVIAAILSTQISYGEMADHWRSEEAGMKRVASLIDQVMDRCDYDRYLQQIARGGGPYAYTRHSPYGPVFIHYSRFIGASKEYQKAYVAALQTAPLILMNTAEDSNLSDYALQYIGVRYSNVAPPCAGDDFSQPKPYVLLFRTSKQ